MLVPSKPCCQNVFSASCSTSSGSNSLLLMPLTRPFGLIWQDGSDRFRCRDGAGTEWSNSLTLDEGVLRREARRGCFATGCRQRRRTGGSQVCRRIRRRVLLGSKGGRHPLRNLDVVGETQRHCIFKISCEAGVAVCRAPAERRRRPSGHANSGNPTEISANAAAKETHPTAIKRNKAARDCEYGSTQHRRLSCYRA